MLRDCHCASLRLFLPLCMWDAGEALCLPTPTKQTASTATVAAAPITAGVELQRHRKRQPRTRCPALFARMSCLPSLLPPVPKRRAAAVTYIQSYENTSRLKSTANWWTRAMCRPWSEDAITFECDFEILAAAGIFTAVAACVEIPAILRQLVDRICADAQQAPTRSCVRYDAEKQ